MTSGRIHAGADERFDTLATRTLLLSVLLHVLLLLVLWRLIPSAPATLAGRSGPIWAEMTKPAANPGRLVESRDANRQRPDAAKHVAREAHRAPVETRRSDLPVRDFGGPPRPSSSGGRTSGNTNPGSRSTSLTPSNEPPPSGDSGLPSISAMDLLSRGSFGDYVTSRGDAGTYNPSGTTPGGAIDLNTNEHKYVGYFMHLKERIESAWRMTRPAYHQERSGVLTMTILKNGDLANVELVHGCGDRILDVAVLQAVRNASPFNPLPASWGDEKIDVSFQFHYMLERRGLY